MCEIINFDYILHQLNLLCHELCHLMYAELRVKEL